MSAALIITLRETLEAALIVGILLAYLDKTRNLQHRGYVWGGVGLGLLASVILAIVFKVYLGGFEGRAEEIYEGVAMMIAAGLLTWMILWMINQRHHLSKKLEEKARTHIEKDHPWGLLLLAFVGVAREGIETVIFLQGAALQSSEKGLLVGGVAGMLIAIVLAFVLYKGILKFPLRKFFTISGILLILFAAGLFAHGIHEFQEAGVVPVVSEHIWDVNHILDEKGDVGSLFKGLFGYNGNPNLLEVLGYGLYLLIIAGIWVRIDKKVGNE
jgi:high-affinity iron transporter